MGIAAAQDVAERGHTRRTAHPILPLVFLVQLPVVAPSSAVLSAFMSTALFRTGSHCVGSGKLAETGRTLRGLCADCQKKPVGATVSESAML